MRRPKWFVAPLGALVLVACTTQPGPRPPATTTSAQPTAGAQPNPTVGPLSAVGLTTADGTDPGSAKGQSLKIPSGWTAEIWANIPGARRATWDPNGSLLVSNGGGGTVTRLTPTDDSQAPTSEVILDGLNNPQGLAFALNGKILVVGESDRIVSYDYANGHATNPKTIVDSLPTDCHGSKGIAVNGDTAYHSLGSESNRDPADRTTEPVRAAVWSVGLNGGANQLVATGVRNGFAVA